MNLGRSFILLVSCVFLVTGCVTSDLDTPAREPADEARTPAIPSGEADSPEGFETYSDPVYGVSLQYPSHWEIATEVMGTLVAVLSPRENDTDPFRENVNLLVEDVSAYPGITLAEYTEAATDQLHQFITDIDILESGDATVGELPAHFVIYTGRQGQLSFKWKQWWTLKDDSAFIFSYSGEVDGYDAYLKEAERMAASIQF